MNGSEDIWGVKYEKVGRAIEQKDNDSGGVEGMRDEMYKGGEGSNER